MKNILTKVRPDLIKEWHPHKNIYNVAEVTTGSDKIVYWKCQNCDHEWRTQLKNRAIHNTGCPICHQRWNTSFNELSIFYYLKQVFKHVESGTDTGVKGIKEVDILLPEYRVVIEYDSLYRHYQREYIDEHKTSKLLEHGYIVIRMREEELPPIEKAINIFFETNSNAFLTQSSIKEVIQRLIDISTIDSVASKTFNQLNVNPERDQLDILRQVSPVHQEVSLLEVNPKVADSWDEVANAPFKPSHFKANSNFKVWWVCSIDKRHKWRTQINVRNKGHGCPFCSGQRVTPERSLSVKSPDIADEWDFTLNEEHPNEVAAHSNKEYWWLCPDCHSSYDNALNERMSGENCPYCAGKRVNLTNSLKAKFPNMAKEWHPTENGDLTPNDVTYGSNKKVWWKCNRGHEWRAVVSSRTTGNRGCKVCYEQYGRNKPRTVHDKTKSLLYKAPDVARQWHPILNDIGPEDVGRSARHEYWWLCNHCNYEWKKAPNSRRSSRCPACNETALMENGSSKEDNS